MLKVSIRFKLFLLLALGLSLVAMSRGTVATLACANQRCVAINNQQKQVIGYGCISPGSYSICQASVQSCYVTPCV